MNSICTVNSACSKSRDQLIVEPGILWPVADASGSHRGTELRFVLFPSCLTTRSKILQLWHAPFPTSKDVAYNQQALARITGPKFGPH